MTMARLQRGAVIAVAIKLTHGCVKLSLPNGHVVDILTSVLEEVNNWVQREADTPEGGGYIVGYEHKDTGNVVLERVSVPQRLDRRTRTHFDMLDPGHKVFLLKEKCRKSFYMGVWHTHPQDIPIPSATDWEDWGKTLESDKTACDYIFFLISGTECTRVWVGDSENNTISEIFECTKIDGLYTQQ